jgi:alkylhydroperoxidase/carboxymuconolactone decarboxylase family protein YurZ
MVRLRKFLDYLSSLRYTDNDGRARLLAVLSATIAVSRGDLIKAVIIHIKNLGIEDKAIYETVLQSYLLLGFPRMIEAALVFNEVFGDRKKSPGVQEISLEEARSWHKEGHELCRQVYGANYEKLRSRFLAVSPEIFRWMVLEGYGKVLNRDGMTQVERELAEVAALIIDGRKRQLISHVLGSLNVGAEMSLIKQVCEDVRLLAADKHYSLAKQAIADIEEKNETKI